MDEKLNPVDEFLKQNSPEPKKKKKRIWLWLSIAAWLFFLLGVGVLTMLIENVKSGKYGELPSPEILENPENPLATSVFTVDGKEFGKYYQENRTNVKYEEISQNLIKALIATEDERFKNHAGIDFEALLRVAVKTILLGNQSAGGGSTISQQLAKNLFRMRKTRADNRLIMKLKEWVMAVRLEKKYTKEEIITMYFNTVDFSSNSFGIYAASQTYFGKLPSELDLVESAALVGMQKAVTRYNPLRNPENSKVRRSVVYHQMLKNNIINQNEFDSLKEVDLDLTHVQIENHNSGLATYFREQLRQFLHQWQDKTGYNIYRDGLRVYTTIDSRIQEKAEKAVYDHMKGLQKNFFDHWKGMTPDWVKDKSIYDQVRFSNRYHNLRAILKKQGKKVTEEELAKVFKEPRKMRVFSYRNGGEIDTIMSPLDSVTYYKYFLHAGMMAMEPSTGYIKAWVGGIDHKHFKYDHVNIRAKRQVGSTFKPFVYLTGLENNYTPCMKADNIPVVFEFVTGVDEDGNEIIETWDARNSDGKYGGKMTLQQGMANSVNTITAWLMKRVGPPAVVRKARDLGITSHIEPVPSICLGTADISVYEMVGAFNAFNNNGLWIEPTFVAKIEDQYGNVIENFIPDSREAVNEIENYAIVKMLQRVVQKGTAMRLISSNYYNIRTPLAGKTGTTQGAADGWFIGFQPGITVGVWVGGEVRDVHFRNMQYGQGARMAMPIFGNFIVDLNADERFNYGEATEFQKPAGELPFSFDCPDIKYDPEEIQNQNQDPLNFNN